MEQAIQYLEAEFHRACVEVAIREEDQRGIASLMAPLRDKNEVTREHYLHSLRVGLTLRAIGRHIYHDERPLLFAGALHDIGKALTPLEVLGKTGAWTGADQRAISRHVMDGYRMLSGRFKFTAAVMLRHHRFQERGYPKVLPASLADYSESTRLLIFEYGRLLALADVYDALHRSNSKFKVGRRLSGEEVKEKMLAFNPDRKKLVLSLYDSGVFTV